MSGILASVILGFGHVATAKDIVDTAVAAGSFKTLAEAVEKLKTDFRILMVGLDAAGKTTVLYKLKLNDVVTTIPTIGFNVEKIEYKNLNMLIWDIGGQDRLRPLWRHYYDGCNGIIFVVDSSDKTRMGTAKNEIAKICEEVALRDAKILIFANKQDMPHALSASELTNALEMRNYKQEWYVQPCCAVDGRGLYEGLDWLSGVLSKRK